MGHFMSVQQNFWQKRHDPHWFSLKMVLIELSETNWMVLSHCYRSKGYGDTDLRNVGRNFILKKKKVQGRNVI